MIDRTTHHHDRCYRHHHMKMCDHKQSIRKRHTHRSVSKEQPSHSAVNKEQQKGDRKQHRDRQMNIAAPERQYPVVHFKRSGYRDDQSRRREEEAESRDSYH